MNGVESEMTLDSRHFFGLKDDNGGSNNNVRMMAIIREAVKRAEELRKAGYTEDQIKDDLNGSVGHLKLDLSPVAS